jgi:hypothetical protein
MKYTNVHHTIKTSDPPSNSTLESSFWEANTPSASQKSSPNFILPEGTLSTSQKLSSTP